MAKIALLKSTYSFSGNIRATPPLGIMYLASVLQSKNHQVIIIDMRLPNNTLKKVVDDLIHFKPDIIGISVISNEAKIAHLSAIEFRKHLGDDVKIVLGGPYPTSVPNQVLADSNIDAIILNEGEVSFPQVVDAFVNNNFNLLNEIKGIGFKNGENYVFTPPSDYITDLDSLPFPAWNLIDFDEYSKLPRFARLKHNRYMVIFTSRSCPFKCIYCHNVFGKGFRKRSAENVYEEIESLVTEYGVKEIEIIDDIFNLDHERVMAICDKIINNRLNIKLAFPNGLRFDCLNRDMIGKLKAAGTYFMAVPVETATPRLQKMIRKNLDINKVNKAIDIVHEHGIITLGYFMLGFPTETKEEIKKTIEFACNSELNFASFLTVTPFQGTELWEKFVDDKIVDDNLSEYYDVYNRNEYNISEVSDEELNKLKFMAYQKFNRGFIKRIILTNAYKTIALKEVLIAFLNRIIELLYLKGKNILFFSKKDS